MSLAPYFDDGTVRRSALAEANAAKTHCPAGHPYTPENTYVRAKDGARICKSCTRERNRRWYSRNPRPKVEKPARVTTPTGIPRLDDKIRAEGSCWVWTAARRSGYGIVRFDGRIQVVHRIVYALLRGEIPEDLVLDHICRNRACCNPDHLEPVEFRVNILRGVGAAAINARKTHCKYGHPLAGDNLVPWARYRMCRICTRTASREKQRKRRARARAQSAGAE